MEIERHTMQVIYRTLNTMIRKVGTLNDTHGKLTTGLNIKRQTFYNILYLAIKLIHEKKSFKTLWMVYNSYLKMN